MNVKIVGIIKCDKSYKRLRRKGLENAQLEILLVACGYNLYKYYNKISRLDNRSNAYVPIKRV